VKVSAFDLSLTVGFFFLFLATVFRVGKENFDVLVEVIFEGIFAENSVGIFRENSENFSEIFFSQIVPGHRKVNLISLDPLEMSVNSASGMLLCEENTL
jgi:hypothetical protein